MNHDLVTDGLLPVAQGKSGWPWAEEIPPLSDSVPDGKSRPRVSIVTPSFNQGQYLEETIRSVLLQGYPNLEYIIIDGGSTDNSVEIIRKYEPWLAYWVSEPDSGQADAINKGFSRATGEIFGWLNSDDIYNAGSLQFVGRYFIDHPDCELLYGLGDFLDEDGNRMRPCPWIRPFDRALLLSKDFILQPASFWRRSLWEKTGPLDVAYNWGLDWEWLIRATSHTHPHHVQARLGDWRITPYVKSFSANKARRAELASISRRYGGFWQPTNLIYHADRLANWMDERFGRGRIARIPQYPVTALRLALRSAFDDRFLL